MAKARWPITPPDAKVSGRCRGPTTADHPTERGHDTLSESAESGQRLNSKSARLLAVQAHWGVRNPSVAPVEKVSSKGIRPRGLLLPPAARGGPQNAREAHSSDFRAHFSLYRAGPGSSRLLCRDRSPTLDMSRKIAKPPLWRALRARPCSSAPAPTRYPTLGSSPVLASFRLAPASTTRRREVGGALTTSRPAIARALGGVMAKACGNSCRVAPSATSGTVTPRDMERALGRRVEGSPATHFCVAPQLWHLAAMGHCYEAAQRPRPPTERGENLRLQRSCTHLDHPSDPELRIFCKPLCVTLWGCSLRILDLRPAHCCATTHPAR